MWTIKIRGPIDEIEPILYNAHGLVRDHRLWRKRISIYERLDSDTTDAVIDTCINRGWDYDLKQVRRKTA